MARYSRRRGPTAQFELTAAFQTIPQLTITREWDDGEVLILFRHRYNNTIAAQTVFQRQPLLDGAAAVGAIMRTNVPANSNLTTADFWFLPLTAGPHTIALQASGDAAA